MNDLPRNESHSKNLHEPCVWHNYKEAKRTQSSDRAYKTVKKKRLYTKYPSQRKTKIIGDMKSFYLEYIFAAVLYAECLAGIMVNMIILVAISLKWKTLRSLQTCYQILTCLLMSRSLYFLSVFSGNIISVFFPWILLDIVIVVAMTIEVMIFYYTNLWFATILCVFYCVKIASYNFKFWMFLKTKILIGVPWLLLASMVISVSSSLSFSSLIFFDLKPKNVTNGAIGNTTVDSDVLGITLQKQLLILLLGSCPPFLIFCITIFLLLHSLWMHTRRMRRSGSGFRTPNLESHFSVVKSMCLFLVLQLIYFILVYASLSTRLYNNKIWGLFSSIIICSPPFLHSLYIISSSSELKKTCISMFQPLITGAHC